MYRRQHHFCDPTRQHVAAVEAIARGVGPPSSATTMAIGTTTARAAMPAVAA
jgi:hypothetical protein